MATAVKQINNWLKRPGNSMVKLALELNYDTTDAIRKWMKNGVPKNKWPRVAAIIRRKSNGLSQSGS